ncbi:MAG: HalOD1 output domain-containing protein [Halodesulfurarchaeum sp.]
MAIIDAIAKRRGTPPTDLGFTLEDYVDVDAIVALSKHEQSEWTLTFPVDGHDVRIDSEGIITVDGENYPRSPDSGPFEE